MTSPLFRKEAIEHQRRKLTGEVFLVQPVKFMMITLCLVVLTIVAAIFLIQNTYARKETVVGYLTPDIGLVRVASKEFGVVQEVFVKQGDLVQAGDQLFSISIEATLQGGGLATEEMMASLEAEEQEIAARFDLVEQRFSSQKQELRQRALAFNREITDLAQQKKLQQERVFITQRQYSTYTELLAEDAASKIEADAARERWIQAQQELNSLSRQIEDRRSQVKMLRLQFDALPNQQELAISELNERLMGFQQRRTVLKQQAGYVITSPVAGRIANLSAKVGASITPGGIQAAILPDGGQLIAQLFAPTRAAGFVEPGQPVRIMYEAFPFQRFGAADGTVTNVSATVLLPQDGPSSIGIQEPVYKVVVALDKQYVDAYGKEFALQDGMTLQADIVLDRRSLIEWLFEPLIALGRR